MYVYILTNPTKTTLYVGVTSNLNRRLYEHSSGRGDACKFTGRYQTDLLVYFEICPDATQAIAREKQLKGWTRRKKEGLINAFNPTWEAIDLENWEVDSNEAAKMLRLRCAALSMTDGFQW